MTHPRFLTRSPRAADHFPGHHLVLSSAGAARIVEAWEGSPPSEMSSFPSASGCHKEIYSSSLTVAPVPGGSADRGDRGRGNKAERSFAGGLPGSGEARKQVCKINVGWGVRKKNKKQSMYVTGPPSWGGAGIEGWKIPAQRRFQCHSPARGAEHLLCLPHCPGCTPAPSRDCSHSVACRQLGHPTHRGEVKAHRGYQACGPSAHS